MKMAYLEILLLFTMMYLYLTLSLEDFPPILVKAQLQRTELTLISLGRKRLPDIKSLIELSGGLPLNWAFKNNFQSYTTASGHQGSC